MSGSFHPGIDLSCKFFQGKAGEEPPPKSKMQLEHSDFQKETSSFRGQFSNFILVFAGVNTR